MNPRTEAADTITVDAQLSHDTIEASAAADLRAALSAPPYILQAAWLYDEVGSQIFDEITRLPDYYPTEAERSILAESADELAALTGARTIVELGSGTSDKTRTLLDAFWSREQLERFVPLDVSNETLIEAAEMLSQRYEGLEVHAVVGDFTRHLAAVPHTGDRLIAFLGGTLGNFYPSERARFLAAVAASLDCGEWLLLGVDLLKDRDRIMAAYNDDTGVSARFNANVLNVLNDRFDADFPLDAFEYRPMWDQNENRVDMRLRATRDVDVRVAALDLDQSLAVGTEIQVEISTKFAPADLDAELLAAGLEPVRWFESKASDDGHLLDGDFGMVLARRS